jgi:hypothetical protein
MSGVIICDLDNCISDDGWRIDRIEWEKHGDARYHNYHTLSPFDKSCAMALPLHPWLRVFFFTARPETYRVITQEWLRRVAEVKVHQLFMRPDGFLGTSPEVKQMQLGWLLNPNNQYDVALIDIVAAYDDHQGVIDMYKRNGIAGATRHFIHKKDAFHDPLRNTQAH